MKKIVVMPLVLLLALAMGVTAFAANPKITTQTAQIAGGDIGEKKPGQEIWLPLVKDAFDGAEEDLTMADVKASKIAVKQSAKSGSKAIAELDLKANSSKVACIYLKLADPYTGTKPLDFETSIYLTIDGKRQSFNTEISGSLANIENTVVADTDYIDLSGGATAICEETTSGKVEVYLGDNVTVFIKMQKGKTYYGNVSRSTDADDDELLQSYPDIEDVYTLTTIGMTGSGKIVSIDTGGEDYHAYSKNLEYLGKTSDMLPYSEKYYLAVKKLEIVETEPELEPGYEDDGSEEIEEDPEAETDGLLPAIAPKPSGNPSGNPDTGVSPILGVSIAAAVVSLTTLATLVVRKARRVTK